MYDDIPDVLALIFADAPSRRLKAGAYLFHAGDPVQWLHRIETGRISLERVQQSGTVTRFQDAGPGEVLAEASVSSDRYHCDARLTEDVRLRRISKAAFLARLAEDPALALAWSAHLAHLVQRARLMAELRSFKTVAQRLDAWLDLFGPLPAKGRWQAVAHELSVSREALYRELARRRRAGARGA